MGIWHFRSTTGLCVLGVYGRVSLGALYGVCVALTYRHKTAGNFFPLGQTHK